MEWQPIETAPKDETIFLAWTPTHNGGCVDFCIWANLLERWQDPDAEVGGKMEPTHWMPLPEAPNVSGNGPA